MMDKRGAMPIEQDPDAGLTQTETPANVKLPPRGTALSMVFDKDGYALTHNRNKFAAAKWLAQLIEAETQWSEAAADISEHLRTMDRTPDHIEMQIKELEPLFAPWLFGLRTIDRKADSIDRSV